LPSRGAASTVVNPSACRASGCCGTLILAAATTSALRLAGFGFRYRSGELMSSGACAGNANGSPVAAGAPAPRPAAPAAVGTGKPKWV